MTRWRGGNELCKLAKPAFWHVTCLEIVCSLHNRVEGSSAGVWIGGFFRSCQQIQGLHRTLYLSSLPAKATPTAASLGY